MNGSTIDGSSFGSVTGVTVAKDGTVTAQFSNGLSQDVYKVPVATFTNPDGLGQVSGNAYIATNTSGTANVNQANSGGAGGIQSQSLEASTVDLATEFTNLITTQRAYQRLGPHRHHRGPDAAAAGAVAVIVTRCARKAREIGPFSHHKA